ncbi:MAG: bifunctional homocysteine S-methyltransferase/methylenetetrahydrofolate reductase [Chloroflexi bacterium]|nr:bifunctional homocysteine S-methyltransferase/methylenetetrahydrofolate reductase [Chloroflexota bacterium]
MEQTFYHRLTQGPLLADGAMGTELHRRGNLPTDVCFEYLNLSNPELVRQVHLDYLAAGAELIETNSFGANRIRLEQHGLAHAVVAINRRAVELAREAQHLTGQPVWIAGAVGPLGKALAPLGPLSPTEARAAFQEQIQALVKAGVNLLILETFPSLAEVQQAIAAAKSVTDLPIIAQLTFTHEGHTMAGEAPHEVVRMLAPLEVAAIGANCSVGSQPMLSVIEEMAPHTTIPLSALPNAGFPTYVEGRLVYFSSPAYMAEYAGRMLDAGATVIGGCCGTTPEHIAAIREVLRRHRVRRKEGETKPAARPSPKSPSGSGRAVASPSPSPEPTNLARKLGKDFVVTVEVHPPRGFDVSSTLVELRKLLRMVHVDAFNATDSPLAQGRMNSLAMSTLLQTRLGVEAILHLATRYRNLLALHSDLLGAHALGVRNVFVFMGDPPAMGDYPQAISLSDVTSSGLIRLIKQANAGLDLSGRPIDQPTSFLVGCALNMEASDMDKEFQSLERKVAAGADFILTQAVFDPETVEKVHRRLGGFPRPVIMGILPLRSFRHAEFLQNEVPGIVIPEALMRRMRDAGRWAAEAGVTAAQELLKAVHAKIAGAYFIPSFGHYQTVAEVLAGLSHLAAPPVAGGPPKVIP